MKIILYRSLAEREIVDKRSYIYKVYEVDGFFRDSVDVISPVVRIELTYGKTSNLPKFNYAYINVLNKYYFIDNIVIVRTNEKDTNNITIMYELYLSEDVLTTFQSSIYGLNVAVNRQEYEYNDYLKDNLLPCSVVPSIEEHEIHNFQDRGVTYLNYILTVASGYFSAQDDYQPKTQNPNAVFSDSYLFTQNQIMLFGKKLMGGSLNLADVFSLLFNDPSQGIINLILLPFKITSRDVKYTDVTSIAIGKGVLTEVPCRAIYDTTYIDKNVASFRIAPKYNNFLDYSPYTTIEMYLPFYGFLEMDANLITDKVCEVHYIIDITSGQTKIKIIDSVSKNTYYTVNCQVGIQISMTTSNISEKIRNITTTAISIGAGVVGLGTASSLSALNAPRMLTPRTGKITKAYAKYSASEGLKSTQRKANFISETTGDVVSALQNHIRSGAASSEIVEWSEFPINYTNKTYDFRIYWRVRRITPITIDNYNRLVGKPSAVSGVVRNFLGYTEISACHFENLYDCLTDEVNIIEDSLRNGIIINNTHKVNINVVDFFSGDNIPYNYFSIRNSDNKVLFLSQNSSTQDVYVDSNTDTEYWVAINLKDTSISKIVNTVETNSTAIEIEYRKPPSTSAGWLYFWLKIKTTTNGNFNDLSLKVKV